MMARVLARPQLSQLVPSLFSGRHVLALVPAYADTAWVATAAWEFARAAAEAGGRVVLVDLSSDGSPLDSGALDRAPRGLSHVFQSDEPLNEAAREQGRPGLFFIGRGDPEAPMEPIWSHPRWTRLARGFASEGALLLLFAPAAALAHLPIELEGIVLLAPEGVADPGLLPQVAARMNQGTTVLGVVTDRPAPSPRAAPPALRSSGARRSAGSRWRRGVALAVVALVILGAARWLPRWSAGGNGAGPPAEAGPGDAGDSLYYSVQLATFNALEPAMARATELEQRGVIAAVSPARQGNQGTWFRVLAGAVATPRAADTLRQRLWQEGLLERPQGTILRAPQAYRIAEGSHRAAQELARGLRERGVPAYIVESRNEASRVYVGAFDLPGQAHAIDTLLASAGIAGSLVFRTGMIR